MGSTTVPVVPVGVPPTGRARKQATTRYVVVRFRCVRRETDWADLARPGTHEFDCIPKKLSLILSSTMKPLLPCLAFLMLAQMAPAQPTNPIPLWPDGAPGALGKADKDIPTLTPFFPDPAKATGAAMIICPGGGYAHLAPHEGKNYALWLNEQGVAGFVLKYRLGPDYHHPSMLLDAARAVRMVRASAADWKIDPNRIGIMGSSAGGHLAATLVTHFDAGQPDATDPIDRQSSRPNIGVLCYAVITMGGETHGGSRKMLLGDDPSPELVQLLSNELHVTKETPPCFIFTTAADKTVPPANSIEFAAALNRAGVPFDLHIYEKGGHGMGLGSHDYDPAKFHPWTKDCSFWLKEQGFVK
jgi:acetyl esterase/lipase